MNTLDTIAELLNGSPDDVLVACDILEEMDLDLMANRIRTPGSSSSWWAKLIVLGGPLDGSTRKAFNDKWPQSFLFKSGDVVHRYVKVGFVWKYKGSVKSVASQWAG